MDLILFSGIFWLAAILFIALEITKKTGSPLTTLIKAIPAIMAILFVLLPLPSSSLFYPLLIIAFIFCGLGDIAMEYDILPGLGMFLFGHIVFIVNFIMHSTLGADIMPLVVFAVSIIIVLVYIIMYHRYLMTAEEPTKLIRAVDVYAFAISMTLCTSILLWISTGNPFGFVPVIGILFFILSDSLIGIREFHHRFSYDEPITMITYYLAIFLLALSAIFYAF